jgi:hypothetical protein
MTTEPRPLQHLRAIAERYPEAWQHVANMRADKGKGLPDWPDWCYLPLAGAYAIVSGGGSLGAAQGIEVGRVGALAAWRAAKGIYNLDPTMLDALWSTPLDGHLPDELLERLPEWCVYIETPGKTWAETPLHGFFAHLESDASNGRRELRLLLDLDEGLIPVPLHLTGGNLSEAVESGWVEANKYGAAIDDESLLVGSSHVARSLAPLVSTLLYLCTVNSEIADSRGSGRKPENPKPQGTRRGTKEFPASTPTSWNVAYRLGAAIRAAQSREQPEPQGDTHASPRSHIRRAHWHTFSRGTGRGETFVKWLPPIPVNLGDQDLPAVGREVE